MNRHFAPRNKSPTLRLDFCFPHLEMSSENFHFAAWVAWVFGFLTRSIFFNMLSIFLAGRFWNGSLRVPPHESTCSLHTHPGCDLSRSGISPVDSFTERELQKIRHEPDWNIWESMWQWLFHVVSHEFQWNVTFPETDAHDLAQGARWSKRSKRSLCSSNWRHPNILPTNFWTSIG